MPWSPWSACGAPTHPSLPTYESKLGIVLIVRVLIAVVLNLTFLVVLVVLVIVDDAVLGPSGLFTLTGRISYRLVRVGPTACRDSQEHVWTGLPDVADCAAGLVGVLPLHPLTPSGTFFAPDALFAALTLLRVLFPVAGGLSDALVAPATTSGSIWTAWPGPL